MVAVGGSAAALGALLALIAGVGRTTLAMARGADLPLWLAAVHPRYGVPHRAEVAVAVVVSVLVLTVDLREAIGFSSFGVLVYYLIANLSAFTQPPEQRRFPRWLQVAGAAGCLLLAATLPWQAVRPDCSSMPSASPTAPPSRPSLDDEDARQPDGVGGRRGLRADDRERSALATVAHGSIRAGRRPRTRTRERRPAPA